MEQLLSRGLWEDLEHRKQGEKWFVLSLSNTLLLRLPGWYKITNTVATLPVLQGVSGVSAANAIWPFPRQALVCSQSCGSCSAKPWHGAAWRGMRAHLGLSVFWRKVLELAVAFWPPSWELLCLHLKECMKCKKSKGLEEIKMNRSVLQPFLLTIVLRVSMLKEIKRTVIFYPWEKILKYVVGQHRLVICILERRC